MDLLAWELDEDQLALAEREETARAIRLLLRRPLLTRAAAPEDYELVRSLVDAPTPEDDLFAGIGAEVAARRAG